MIKLFIRDDIRKLNKFKRVYVLASGGKDSTFTALNLWQLRNWIKTDVILFFEDTGNNTKEARATIKQLGEETFQLQFLTSKDYISKKPLKLVIESFSRIPQAKQLLLEGKYSKKVFPCCYALKEGPFLQWLKKDDHNEDCFILSIGISDAWWRRKWLLNLRRQQKRFHFNSQKQVWYYYPLRDIRKSVIKTFLSKEKLFWNTE
ncbi:MAG: hypothetical protein V3V41_00320, partial [Candidatus Heimdallarchaeota archaeon]